MSFAQRRIPSLEGDVQGSRAQPASARSHGYAREGLDRAASHTSAIPDFLRLPLSDAEQAGLLYQRMLAGMLSFPRVLAIVKPALEQQCEGCSTRAGPPQTWRHCIHRSRNPAAFSRHVGDAKVSSICSSLSRQPMRTSRLANARMIGTQASHISLDTHEPRP